jgi:hypothetical protein
MKDFDRRQPDPLLHTYADIITYVKTHLPNIRAAANMTSGATGHANQASSRPTTATTSSATTMTMAELQCAYLVLEHKHKALQNNRQKRSGNGQGNQGKKAKVAIESLDNKFGCKFYCHVHGYQNSHNSSQCKVMLNQPQNFTQDMRKALDPHKPPGG